MTHRKAFFDAHCIENLQKHSGALVQPPSPPDRMAFPVPRHIDQQKPVVPKILRDPVPQRTVEEHAVQENHRRTIAPPAFVDAN